MKKLIAMMLLVLAMVMMAGCEKEEIPFTAKTYEADAQVTEVQLDVRDRKIQVVLSEEENIRIDYFDSEKEFFDICVEGGRLTMTIADNKEWEDYIGKNAPKENRVITLSLPQKMLSTLTLSTTNEDILLPQLTVENSVDLTVNGGNITFDTMDVGSCLAIDVKNGDINGSILGGYDDFDMTCTIKKGDTSLPERKEGGEKALTVNANNGDVNIEFVK